MQRRLVPREKILYEQVKICCAHGHTVEYPLASIEMQQGGVVFMFDVGVSAYLPMSVFPGIYAPQLAELWNGQGKQNQVE